MFTEKLKNQIFDQNKLEPKKPAAKEYPKLNKDEANNIINFFINIESEFRKIIKQKASSSGWKKSGPEPP